MSCKICFKHGQTRKTCIKNKLCARKVNKKFNCFYLNSGSLIFSLLQISTNENLVSFWWKSYNCEPTHSLSFESPSTLKYYFTSILHVIKNTFFMTFWLFWKWCIIFTCTKTYKVYDKIKKTNILKNHSIRSNF